MRLNLAALRPNVDRKTADSQNTKQPEQEYRITMEGDNV